MIENSKKIRELKEAMRAERNISICNRMMTVPGVLKGHSTRTASDFADVDQRTVQLWVARFDEGGIGGLRDAPGRGRASRARYGRIRRLADRLAGRNMLTPRKLRNWIRGRMHIRYSLCSVRRILRHLGLSSKRSTTLYASAAGDDTVRQWQADAAGNYVSESKAAFERATCPWLTSHALGGRHTHFILGLTLVASANPALISPINSALTSDHAMRLISPTETISASWASRLAVRFPRS